MNIIYKFLNMTLIEKPHPYNRNFLIKFILRIFLKNKSL